MNRWTWQRTGDILGGGGVALLYWAIIEAKSIDVLSIWEFAAVFIVAGLVCSVLHEKKAKA